MARKQPKGQIIDMGSIQQLPSAAAEEEPLESSVERFLVERADGVSDAQVKVYKAAGGPSPGPGKPATVRDAFLFSCSPDEFQEEVLQSEYGAGSYRVKMYGTLEGRYGLLCNRLLEIGPAPKSRAAVPQPSGTSGAVNVNVPSGAAEIARAIAEANAPIFAALTTMLQQMNGGGSRKALLEEMQLMAQIVRPAGGGDSLSGISGLKTMLEFAQTIRDSGPSDPEAAPFDVLKKALEVFGGMVQAARERPQSLPAPQAQPAQPQPAQLPDQSKAAASAATLSAEDSMGLMLKSQMLLLLNAAKNDSDPALYSTLIYEQAPDEIISQLESDKWWEALLAIEPGFAPFKSWAEQVRNGVVAMLNEPEEEAGAVGETLTADKESATVPANGPTGAGTKPH